MICSPLMGVFVLLPLGQLNRSVARNSYRKGLWCAGVALLAQTSWEFPTPIDALSHIVLILSYLTWQWIVASQMIADLTPHLRMANYSPKTPYYS